MSGLVTTITVLAIFSAAVIWAAEYANRHDDRRIQAAADAEADAAWADILAAVDLSPAVMARRWQEQQANEARRQENRP